MNVSVDGVGSLLADTVNKQFHGTRINIERYMNGTKLAYIIKGEVATEELRDQIYQTVGSLVGEALKEDEVLFKDKADNGAGDVKVHHLTKISGSMSLIV